MKRTFQPNTKKEKKVHGFRARTKANSDIIGDRRKKGRKKLTK